MQRIALVLVLVTLVACGGGGGPEPGIDGGSDTPNSFLAFTQTFAPFRTWTSFHSDGPVDDGTFMPDVLGPRTQYINQVPPAGSTEFPVGTVIVEARESSAMKIFAGVKRGLDFNTKGAKNWEWFELDEDLTATVQVSIQWRGVGPPLGDTYGGDPNGTCNSCHRACAANDFICSPKLQLATFAP
ncbi:MAG: hypothetical protein ABIY55_01710 [Kofleriaceae bacterium]